MGSVSNMVLVLVRDASWNYTRIILRTEAVLYANKFYNIIARDLLNILAQLLLSIISS